MAGVDFSLVTCWRLADRRMIIRFRRLRDLGHVGVLPLSLMDNVVNSMDVLGLYE